MEPLNQFSHVYTKTKTPKIKMSNIVSKREDSALGESLTTNTRFISLRKLVKLLLLLPL